MKSEECPKLDQCFKMKIILDKDLLDFQYEAAIRQVCASCSQAKCDNDANPAVNSGKSQ